MGEALAFLRTVFGVSGRHPMFQPDVMRWKCFTPHPFWEGSRGYTLRYKGAIAAFGCLAPCRFLTGSGMVTGCDVIDWAGSKAVPGAGLMLYRHIQGLTGTMMNIGGTDDARSVLPRLGFQQRAELHHFTRMLRPWRHMRQAERRDWKAPLRLARDYRELARSLGASLPVRRLESFAGVSVEAFPDPSVTGQVVCARTPESLAYFLACPAARMEAYLLDGSMGYFLLSRAGHRCRIADLWIRSAKPQVWAQAYATAASAAAADPDTTEVTAAASLSPQTDALQRAGYRRTHAEPVFLLDPDGRLSGHSDLTLGLLENDAFYWRQA